MSITERQAQYLKRVTEYTATIDAAIAKGFKNETARKEVLDYLNRSYSYLRDFLSDEHHKVQDRTEEQDLLIYENFLPFGLHHLRERHVTFTKELIPDYVEMVDRTMAIFKQRESIRAMELLPKATPRKELPIQEGDKTQWRGNCQCCGRDQAVMSGHMAHHGYEVRHHYFRGACTGHQFAPLQTDRRQADAQIALMHRLSKEYLETAQALRDGSKKPVEAPESMSYKAKMVPFAQAPVRMQNQAVEQAIYENEKESRSMISMANSLQSLADTLHGTPLRLVKL